MTQDNLIMAALIVLVLIAVYIFLQKRKVKVVMEANTEVVPLMMQKSTQMKVARLQQATLNNTDASNQLQLLVADYQSKQIGIKEYNDRLDRMITTLNVDL